MSTLLIRHRGVAVPILALMLLLPARLQAARVQVPPGNGTLQAAIDAAAPGDTLILGQTGVMTDYFGPVTITKSALRIIPVRSSYGVTIDAGCGSASAVTIMGDKITLGLRAENPAEVFVPNIVVYGGSDTIVSVMGSSHVVLNGLRAAKRCGSENYGLDIENSTKVDVARFSVNDDFPQATLRLGNVTGPVRLFGLSLFGSVPGSRLVIANSGAATKAGGSGIRVIVPDVSNGTTAVVNSHGLFFKGDVYKKSNSVSTLGDVQIDAMSGANKFFWCRATSLVDNGTGNCGRNNVGFTLPPCA